MDNQKITKKMSIKDKKFNIKSLFLTCYGNSEGKYFFDIFYLNKNSEFIDIEHKKKLILNGRQLNKKDYIKSLAIDDYCRYKDYVKDCLSGTSKHLNHDSICSTYKIKIDKNNYCLKEMDPSDIKDDDFCIAPLFIRDINKNNEVTSTKIGWPFYIIESNNEQYKRINNFIKSMQPGEKMNYEDIIMTKKFVNKLAKEYYDSFYDIEENNF